MTLSGWFRDYVFMPLAIWLRGLDPKRRAAPARSVSLIVTMLLIGVWHAPTLPYVVWGLCQGVILAAHAALRQSGRRPWPVWAGRVATLAALLAGWVLLRSNDLAMAGNVYAALLGLRGVERVAIPGVTPWFVVALAVLLGVTSVRREASNLEPGRSWAFATATAVLLTLAVLALGRETPFVYLQF
jgi:D-alanyl-lipoteichoic acid acyltransferase DltB (MBOAT superfamily)